MSLKTINWLRLVISIIIPFLAATIGSAATTSALSTWYIELNKPSFNPPNWIFGPVWTLLYFLMGIALYLVWNAEKSIARKNGIILFAIQLILNTLWSVVFFGLKSPEFAVYVIVLLWIMILLTIIHFMKVSRIAGALLIPYILWVSFATVLNYFISVLN